MRKAHFVIANGGLIINLHVVNCIYVKTVNTAEPTSIFESSVVAKLVCPRKTLVCKFLHTSVSPLFTVVAAKSPHNFTSTTWLPSARQTSVRRQFFPSYIGETYKYITPFNLHAVRRCHLISIHNCKKNVARF